MVCSLLVVAQAACGQQLCVGAHLGMALSGFTGTDANIPGFSAQYRLGFAGGVYVHHTPKRWQHAYLAAELMFASPKGMVYDGAQQRSRVSLSYLELPLFIGLKAWPQRTISMRFYGGSVVGLCLGADRRVQDKNTGNEIQTNLAISNSTTADVRPWDYSLAGGVGIDLKRGVWTASLDVRYQQSLGTISPAQNPSPTTLNQSMYVLVGIGRNIGRAQKR